MWLRGIKNLAKTLKKYLKHTNQIYAKWKLHLQYFVLLLLCLNHLELCLAHNKSSSFITNMVLAAHEKWEFWRGAHTTEENLPSEQLREVSKFSTYHSVPAEASLRKKKGTVYMDQVMHLNRWPGIGT